jgi:hypothetical protein
MDCDAPFSLSQLSITTDYYHNLSSSGADNPSSQYQPPRCCLWIRNKLVPYKDRKALLSEPIVYSS